MLQSPTPRLDVDEATAQSFVESLERFSVGLSATERAILFALMRAAMDPWSRSLVEPPAELTSDEAAALDRAAAREGEDP
jgi:hypothetical protein